MGAGRRDPKRSSPARDRAGRSARRIDKLATRPVVAAPALAAPKRAATDRLFGRHVVLEALRAGRPIRRILIAASAHGESIDQIEEAARARSVPIQRVERQRLDELSSHHQGVIAEAAPFRYVPFEAIEALARDADPPPLLVALDSIQDPQNLGSLLRTSAAVGARGIVIPKRRAVGVTPAVTRAAAGAAERLPVAQVGNLVRALEALKRAGLWVVGLDARAPTPYTDADLSGPIVLVIGGEGRGVRPLVRQTCDVLVSIPMPGGIESLNAAVAGSIVLYEALRQRTRGTSQSAEAGLMAPRTERPSRSSRPPSPRAS